MPGGGFGGTNISHVVVVMLAPMLPAASRMRTRSVWLPGVMPLNVAGDVHAAHVAPSSEHCAAAPSLPRVKLNVATDDAVGEVGPEVMTAVPVGGMVSTAQRTVESVLALPATSVLRISST